MIILAEFIRTARSMLRRPLLPALLVLVIATGVAFLTTAFSALDAMIWRPLAFGDKSRYAMIGEYDANSGGGPMPTVRVDAYVALESAMRENRLPSAEALIPVRERDATLVVDGIASREIVTSLAAGTMRHLETAPILGRHPADPDGAARSAMEIAIGEMLWDRRFARDPDILGRQVVFDEQTAVIVGVMPVNFQFHRVSEVWSIWPEEELFADPSKSLKLLAKLKRGSSWNDLATEASPILRAAFQARTPSDTASRTRYASGPFGAELLPPEMAFLVLGSFSLVLVAAFMNVATLFLARTRSRTQQLVTLATLGAGRAGIWRHVLAEITIVVAVGGALALVLSNAALTSTRNAMSGVLPHWVELHLDARSFAVATAALLTALILVALPAWRLTRRMDIGVLLTHSGILGGSARHGKGASALIATQVSAAVLLAACTVPLAMSAFALADVRSGRDDDRVLEIGVAITGDAYRDEESRDAFAREVMARLESEPVVEAASRFGMASSEDGGVWGDSLFTDVGDAPLPWLRTRAFYPVAVSDNYLDIVGLELQSGTGFPATLSRDDERVAIVSAEVARRLWPDESPLGRRFRWGEVGEWTRVIGVAEDDFGIDSNPWGTTVEPEQNIYYSERQVTSSRMEFRVRLRETGPNAILAVREAVERVDPTQALGRAEMLTERIAAHVKERKWLSIITGSGALASLLLSMIGVCGLVSYYTIARLPELALRLVLGSDAPRAAWLVARQTLRSVVLGIVLSLLPLFVVQIGLRRFVYETSVYDPRVIASVGLLVSLVAVAALLVPLRRLQRIAPHELLRTE